jgi:nucleotide-binding universal stress UspA family protein
MITISRILCPTDFSSTSTHAIDLATHIAQWYGSRIAALHVVRPIVTPYPGLPAVDPHGDPNTEAAERRRLCGETARAFSPATAAGIPVDVMVHVDQPAHAILECATSLPADLIVMGTHGVSGFEHLLLGSVTEKVLRKAACPVLTVPPRAHATCNVPFKRVLCAVDFKESSLRALTFALSMAEEADAAITIAHVLEWPWEEPPAPAVETLPPEQGFSLAVYRRDREADAAARLATLIPEGAANWCTPSTKLRHGKPYEQILRIAEEEQADLIVIGVRGRSALDRAIFGSTANHVVRAATSPVLTLRT